MKDLFVLLQWRSDLIIWVGITSYEAGTQREAEQYFAKNVSELEENYDNKRLAVSKIVSESREVKKKKRIPRFERLNPKCKVCCNRKICGSAAMWRNCRDYNVLLKVNN